MSISNGHLVTPESRSISLGSTQYNEQPDLLPFGGVGLTWRPDHFADLGPNLYISIYIHIYLLINVCV